MTKAALFSRTEILECPILYGSAKSEFATCIKTSNALSLAMLDFLRKKSPAERAAWLRTCVRASQVVFQPWSMEIVYVIATSGRTRFTSLLQLLGLSSRTLSDKLKTLRAAGLVDREVFDEQPVRIEYFLTKHGRATAALATPLFAHLAHEALRAAGRL